MLRGLVVVSGNELRDNVVIESGFTPWTVTEAQLARKLIYRSFLPHAREAFLVVEMLGLQV